MQKPFSLNDRVIHKDYPGTKGRVVAMSGPVVIVLWDESWTPANVSNSVDLPARTSRHIPWALQHVQS